MAVIGISKWACPECTYHNWPSSITCVLCGSPKPSEIIPRIPAVKFRPQIQPNVSWSISPSASSSYGTSGASYAPQIICPDYNHSSASHSDTGSGKSQYASQSSKKWICVACTYSNWPNANQCVMCKSLRGCNEPRADYASCVGAVGGAAYDDNFSAYSRDSPTYPPKVKGGKNGNKISSNLENRASKKWKCHKCTYENWPRTTRCTMCQMLRKRTPSPPLSEHQAAEAPHSYSSSLLSAAENSPSHSRTNSNESEATSSSPHLKASSLSPTSSGSSSRLIGYSSDTPEILPSSKLKSASDEVRQIRNRLSSSDWLFLNACLGVVNSDEGPVKAYLRQGGDRARQLTKDESLVLGEPSRFAVGSTLVHLAIR